MSVHITGHLTFLSFGVIQKGCLLFSYLLLNNPAPSNILSWQLSDNNWISPKQSSPYIVTKIQVQEFGPAQYLPVLDQCEHFCTIYQDPLVPYLIPLFCTWSSPLYYTLTQSRNFTVPSRMLIRRLLRYILGVVDWMRLVLRRRRGFLPSPGTWLRLCQ